MGKSSVDVYLGSKLEVLGFVKSAELDESVGVHQVSFRQITAWYSTHRVPGMDSGSEKRAEEQFPEEMRHFSPIGHAAIGVELTTEVSSDDLARISFIVLVDRSLSLGDLDIVHGALHVV